MKNIRLLVMDVDGTLTDGKIIMCYDGEFSKSFNIKDGYGIHDILPKYKIIPAIITGRSSKIVENRCKDLSINYLFQGCKNKLIPLQHLLDKLDLSFSNVAYIGDDLNDLECMSLCAIKGCPNDAVKEVKAICDFIASNAGGEGAVREFIDWIIEEK